MSGRAGPVAALADEPARAGAAPPVARDQQVGTIVLPADLAVGDAAIFPPAAVRPGRAPDNAFVTFTLVGPNTVRVTRRPHAPARPLDLDYAIVVW